MTDPICVTLDNVHEFLRQSDCFKIRIVISSEVL